MEKNVKKKGRLKMALFTFSGGVHPADGKEFAKNSPITEYLPKGDVVLPLGQHIGAPAQPIVSKGDQVLVGQKVAEAGGFVSANIFSSVSGTVKAIEPRMTPAGAKVNSIVIENDGEFKEAAFEAKPYDQMSKDDVLAAIKEAGIVGLGGAGFPTHVKLAPKDPDAIEYIIVNGADCEPYITGDYRILMETPELLIEGLNIVLDMFPKAKGIIGIEDNKKDAIAKVEALVKGDARQSAIGLPFIREKEYSGQTYSVTEYTMSEIIASVYEKIEQTGNKEGILFIDEINCVSETLAPTMLQFLQCKMFGNQKVPDGWIIVAAGNPPEYNKSVRDFDVVTLDRMKKIDVEADYEVWKEYAYQAGIHPAILAYLEIRKEYFYRMETTVDGKAFVTARGWEDLSQLLKVYEELGKDIDREVVFQYLQHLKIAKDFANYYELYKKYKEDYGIERILKGQWNQETIGRLKFAAFDEKLSVVGLLNGKLSEMFAESYRQDAYVTELFGWLKQLKTGKTLSQVVKEIHEDFDEKKKTEKLGKAQEHMLLDVIKTLESYEQISKAEHLEAEAEFERVREEFKKEPAKLEQQIENTTKALDNAFDFMEEAFGQSQEMVVFVTELNVNYYSVWFIKENGCDKYYQYNKGLLFDEQQAEIMAEMDELERKF